MRRSLLLVIACLVLLVFTPHMEAASLAGQHAVAHSHLWLIGGGVTVFGMMIDALLLLSNGQQVTADAVSTNTIDTNPLVTTPQPQLGSGEELALVIVITAVGVNSGSSLMQVIQSAAANLGAADIIGQIAAATADLVAGKVFIVPIPQGYPTKRYLGANYDITGVVDFTVKTWIAPRELCSVLAKHYAKSYVV